MRGSTAGNIGSLNPKMWNARIRVIFTPVGEECEVELELTVSTFGQVFTNSDVVYWNYELAETVSSLFGRQPSRDEFLKQTRRAYVGNGWRGLFLGIVVVAVLIATAILFESIVVCSIATIAAGLLFVVLFRAPRKLTVELPSLRRATVGDKPPIAY